MEKFNVSGICSANRHTALSIIGQTVSRYGCIVDFKMFSDFSTGFVVEIEKHRIGQLHAELKKVMQMETFDAPESASAEPCILLLNVTFIHGKGDLRNEVPDVPG